MTRSTHAPRRARPSSITVLKAATAFAAVLSASSTAQADDFRQARQTAYTETAEPVRGGALRFGLEGGLPTCADPQLALSNSPSYVARPVADSLLDQDIETKKFHPWLAKSWEVNADGTVYSFELRDDVTFSDGSPLTAESVKKNFDGIVNTLGAAAAYAYGYLTHYQETEVTGPHSFKVKFSKPNASFLQGTATLSLAIVSDATAALSREERCAGKIAGTGAFKIAEFTPGKSLVLEGRPEYKWPSALSKNQGAPFLDKVTFLGVLSDSSRLGALVSGQIDLYNVVVPQGLSQLKNGGFKVADTNNGGVPTGFFPSASDGLAADVDIRKAIQHAINRNEITGILISEWFPVATGALTPITPSFIDQSDAIRFDPELSKSILDKAGWTPGADGIREKDGKKLKIRLLSPNYGWNNSHAIFQQVGVQLRKVGIDLEIVLGTPAQTAAEPNVDGFDLLWYNGRYAEPDQLRTVFGIDYSNYAHRKERSSLDDDLERQLTLTNEAERNTLLQQIQRRLIDEALIIPVYNWAQSVAYAPHVHGVYFRPLGGPGVDLHSIWLAKK